MSLADEAAVVVVREASEALEARAVLVVLVVVVVVASEVVAVVASEGLPASNSIQHSTFNKQQPLPTGRGCSLLHHLCRNLSSIRHVFYADADAVLWL